MPYVVPLLFVDKTLTLLLDLMEINNSPIDMVHVCHMQCTSDMHAPCMSPLLYMNDIQHACHHYCNMLVNKILMLHVSHMHLTFMLH